MNPEWLEFHPELKSKKAFNAFYKSRTFRKSLECSCPLHTTLAEHVDSKPDDYMFDDKYTKDEYIQMNLYIILHKFNRIYRQ